MKQYAMSKEHKEMFVKALRSNKYKQGKGNYVIDAASDKPCLCAAGVYLAELNDIWDIYDGQENESYDIDFGDFHKTWIGSPNKIKKNDLINVIIDMNDTLEMSFEGIADWVEDNVESVSPEAFVPY